MCISNIIYNVHLLFYVTEASRPTKPEFTHGYINVGFKWHFTHRFSTIALSNAYYAPTFFI